MIVDASVAFKWIATETDSDTALRVLDMPGLIAPELVLSEVGNAIWKQQRRGEIKAVPMDVLQLTRMYSRLESVAPLITRAVDLGVQLDHPIYDCVYYALAERENVPLITADLRFAKVCDAHGIAGRLRMLETFA